MPSPRTSRCSPAAPGLPVLVQLAAVLALAMVLVGSAAAPRGGPDVGRISGRVLLSAATSTGDAELRPRTNAVEERAHIAPRPRSLTRATERHDAGCVGSERAAVPPDVVRIPSWTAGADAPADGERAAPSAARAPESTGVFAANPSTGPPEG